MKKLIMSLGFAIATVFAVQAQETPQDQQVQTPETEMSEENKTEIQRSELPEEVQTTLETKLQEHEGKQVSQIYESSAEDGKFYEVVLTDGSTEKTIKIKEDGTVKEEKEK